MPTKQKGAVSKRQQILEKLAEEQSAKILLIFGIIFFTIGILELLGLLDLLRFYVRSKIDLAGCNLGKEGLNVGSINIGSGLLIMTFSILIFLISNLGNVIEFYNILKGNKK